MSRVALFVTASLLAGCAMRGPVVADVRCPKGTRAIVTDESTGHCGLPDGKRHGPSWSASARGVNVDGYDHDVLAGPYAHYDARGRIASHGYRPGVTDSTEPSTDVGEASFDSPKTTGKFVSPARVRLFPVQADIAFTATTLVSAEGKATSSFLGGAVDIGLPPREMLHWRGGAYRAFFVSYGVQGAVGTVARSECDDPTIAGSGGFCGSRWILGPYVRIGYARSVDASPKGALPSLITYGKIGFLLGQDRWTSHISSGNALVWRLRAGAGYTALGTLLGLARAARHTREGWRALLLPFAALLEHAEGYVELGSDGATSGALGVGAGVDVGFGL